MPTPTASPAVSSTVGLKNVVLAPLTVDTEETITYGTLQAVAGADLVRHHLHQPPLLGVQDRKSVV